MGVWRQELGEPLLGGGPCHIGLTLGQKKNPGFPWLNRLCPIGERAEKGGQVLRDKSGAAPYSHTVSTAQLQGGLAHRTHLLGAGRGQPSILAQPGAGLAGLGEEGSGSPRGRASLRA